MAQQTAGYVGASAGVDEVPPGLRLVRLVRESASFVVIGVVSTVAYSVLYLVLRGPLGAQAANVLALLVTAVANTAANRRLTFGVTGREGAGRHHVQGLVVFGVGLALTSGSLAVLHGVAPQAGEAVEMAVLVVANLTSTVVRFVAMKVWMFRRSR